MTNCEDCPSAIWDYHEYYGTTKTQRIVTGCKSGLEPEECEEEEDEKNNSSHSVYPDCFKFVRMD